VGAFFINEDTVWGIDESPIYVNENIIISESGSLTIEPGAQVIFDTDVGIEVLGRLDILGTEESSVSFISEGGYWNGLSISGENARVIIQYTNIKNASTVLLINNASATIHDSLFENNDLVVESIESNLVFEGNTFIDNSTLGYIDFDTHITAENNVLSGGDTPALIVSIPDYDNHVPFHKEIQGDIPLYFQESFVIPPDSSLDIIGNARLFFDSSTGITVLGDFFVQGSESDQATFASSARLFGYDIVEFSLWNTWQGITFLPTESREYAMQYCNFSDVQSGIFVMGAQLNIQNCSMDRSVGFIADSAIIQINNIEAEDMIQEFVVGYNSSDITVSNTTVRKTSFNDNRDAITIFGDSSFAGDSLSVYSNSGSLVSSFDGASTIIRNSSFSGNSENHNDLINIFNTSNARFENVTVEDGKSSGIVVFNDSDVHIENSQIKNIDGVGIWIFDGENIPLSQVSVVDSMIQNNSTGVSVMRSIVSLRNNILSGNINFGAYIESGLGSIDAKENDWGSASGPFHEIKNPNGQGGKISNYVRFVPWIGYDVLLHGLINDNWDDEIPEEILEEEIEEEIPPVLQQSFWSSVTNFPGGVITLRKEPSLSGQAIKTFPNDWVVYVQAVQVQDINVIADGYQWFFIRDATDDSTGWIPGKTADGSVEFLPFISKKQDDFEYTASHVFSTKAERAEKIIEIVDHYYNNTDTNKSLYSAADNQGKKITLLKEKSFPIELILAIAIQESHTVSFNNAHVSHDYGHGIMQITFKGLWNEPNNIIKNDWDNRGAYSNYFNSLCKSYDPNKKSGVQGISDYFDCYLHAGTGNNLEKPYKPYKGNSSNVIYKQYVNSLQSIYANIKDGMGVLSLKHPTRCPRESKNIQGLIFTCHDIERLLAVWWYNGESFDLKRNYMAEVSQKLKIVGSHFPNFSYNNSDNLIEKLVIANNNRNSIKVFSPVEFFIKDSLGNITGSKNGIELEDIPNSGYSSVDESAVVFFSEDDLVYELVGTDDDVYGIIIESVEDGEQVVFQGVDVPVIVGERHQYEIDWDIVAQGGNGVKVSIDKDSDNVFEEVLYVSDFVKGDFPRDINREEKSEQKQVSSGGIIAIPQEDIKKNLLEIFQNIAVEDKYVETFDQNIVQPFKDIIKPVAIVVDLPYTDDNIDERVIQKDKVDLQARADNVPIQKKSILIIGGLIFMVLTFLGIRKKMYL
jgi:hypothetical protein